jgi:hypothetical protein
VEIYNVLAVKLSADIPPVVAVTVVIVTPVASVK